VLSAYRLRDKFCRAYSPRARHFFAFKCPATCSWSLAVVARPWALPSIPLRGGNGCHLTELESCQIVKHPAAGNFAAAKYEPFRFERASKLTNLAKNRHCRVADSPYSRPLETVVLADLPRACSCPPMSRPFFFGQSAFGTPRILALS